MKKLLALLLAVLMVVALFAGCAPKAEEPAKDETAKDEPAKDEPAKDEPADKEGFLIGMSVRGLDNPYYVEIVAGAQAVADHFGAEVVVMEHQSDEQLQVSDIKSFLARCNGNGVLYVDPQTASINAEIAELCEEAGVYWSTCWTAAEGIYPEYYDYYVLHQTADNTTGAYAVACAAFDTFNGEEATAVILNGALANDASDERQVGFEQAVSEYPNITVLEEEHADWDNAKTLNFTQTWLNKHGKIDVILCANDSMALAAYEAVVAAGMEDEGILITGFDGIPDAITAIKEGKLFGTLSSNGWAQSSAALVTSIHALQGDLDLSSVDLTKRFYYTEALTVTTDNVAEFEENYVLNHPEINFDADFDNYFRNMETK